MKSMQQIYTPKQDYRVFVFCATFNHSKYIRNALDGFAMQNTNFPFVCLVIDDCSTDGEQEVLKGWMERECDMENAEHVDVELAEIVLVPHKTNHTCSFAFYFLKRNLYKEWEEKSKLIEPWVMHAEYEAMCEGDDFWTNPMKLQKQYDVMEAHPEYAICFHKVQCVQKDGITPVFEIFPYGKREDREVTLTDLAKTEWEGGQWCFHVCSFFFRTKLDGEFWHFYYNKISSFPYTDMPMEMFYIEKGAYWLKDTMSCYRWFSGGWNSTMDANRPLRRKMELRVIAGFREFDEYSGYKYHKEIGRLILEKEFMLEDFWSFKPKFWGLMFERRNVKFLEFLHDHNHMILAEYWYLYMRKGFIAVIKELPPFRTIRRRIRILQGRE